LSAQNKVQIVPQDVVALWHRGLLTPRGLHLRIKEMSAQAQDGEYGAR
jgi:hypothetical protein